MLLKKKTLQRAKLKIMLSEAFSFVMWSTIPPIPFKEILDPLKCEIEAFIELQLYSNCAMIYYFSNSLKALLLFSILVVLPNDSFI